MDPREYYKASRKEGSRYTREIIKEIEEENNLRKALRTGNIPKNTTRKGIKERLRQMNRENKQRRQDHQQDKQFSVLHLEGYL